MTTATKSGGIAPQLKSTGYGLLVFSLFLAVGTLTRPSPVSVVSGITGVIILWTIASVCFAASAREAMRQKIEQERKQAHLTHLVDSGDTPRPPILPETPEIPAFTTLVARNLQTALLYLPFFMLILGFGLQLMSVLMYGGRSLGRIGIRIAVPLLLGGVFTGLALTYALAGRVVNRHQRALDAANVPEGEGNGTSLAGLLGGCLGQLSGVAALAGTGIVGLLIASGGEAIGLPVPLAYCGGMLTMLLLPLYIMYRSFNGLEKMKSNARAELVKEAESGNEEAKEALRRWDAQDNSLESKASGISMKFTLGMSGLLVVMLVVVGLLLNLGGVEKSLREAVMMVLLVGFIVLIFLGFRVISGYAVGLMVKDWGGAELDAAMARGDMAEAVRLVEDLIARKPTHMVYDIAARIYHAAGNLETSEAYARRAVKEAMELTTDDRRSMYDTLIAGYLVNLGAVLISAGRFTEADAVLTQSMQIDGKVMRVYTNLAESLLYQNGSPYWHSNICKRRIRCAPGRTNCAFIT